MILWIMAPESHRLWCILRMDLPFFHSAGMDQWMVWNFHLSSCLTRTAVITIAQPSPTFFKLSRNLPTPKKAALTIACFGSTVSSLSISSICSIYWGNALSNAACLVEEWQSWKPRLSGREW